MDWAFNFHTCENFCSSLRRFYPAKDCLVGEGVLDRTLLNEQQNLGSQFLDYLPKSVFK